MYDKTFAAESYFHPQIRDLKIVSVPVLKRDFYRQLRPLPRNKSGGNNMLRSDFYRFANG